MIGPAWSENATAFTQLGTDTRPKADITVARAVVESILAGLVVGSATRVFPLLLWRRLPILNLARGYANDGLASWLESRGRFFIFELPRIDRAHA